MTIPFTIAALWLGHSVIASAIIPIKIVNLAFIPYSLLPGVPEPTPEEVEDSIGDE